MQDGEYSGQKQTEIHHRVLYQGLVNCTKPLSYFLPFYKIERIVTQIEALEKAFEDVVQFLRRLFQQFWVQLIRDSRLLDLSAGFS